MSSPIEEKCEFFESWKEEFIAVKDYVLSLGLKESQFDIAFDGEMVSDELKYRYDSLKQHGLTSLWFVYDSVRDMSWVIFHARSETGRDVGILWRENDFPYYYDEQEIADHWYSYKEGLKNTQRRIRNIFEDCQEHFIIVKDYVLSLGLKENKNNVVPYGETVSDPIKQSYENLKQHGLSALEFVYNPERNISWLRFHMSNTETDRSGIVWREHEHIYHHDYEEESLLVTSVFPDIIYPKDDGEKDKIKNIEIDELIKKSNKKNVKLQIFPIILNESNISVSTLFEYFGSL